MIHGGKSYVSSPPAVSNDAKCVLICSGNTVSIFSVSTGLLINELEGHQALVTSVIVVPNTSKLLNHCWTCSLDGTIRQWDFFGPELLKTVDIKLPIFSMVIPSLVSKQDDKDSKQRDLFAYVSIEDISDAGINPKSMHGQIRKCNLSASKLVSGVILKEMSWKEYSKRKFKYYKLQLEGVLEAAWKLYSVQTGKRHPVKKNSLEFEKVECTQQPGSYECGYYVMKWMYDITTSYSKSNNDLKKCIAEGGHRISCDQTNDIREKWAQFVNANSVISHVV